MDSQTQCNCSEQLAMAIVPIQEWCNPYDLDSALAEGTIFPCLNLAFHKAPEGDTHLCNCSANATLNPTQHSRELAMSQLMKVSFALNDLTLYLDTHPNCANGLKLFYQLMDERLQILAGFAKEYEPLTQASMITGECDQNQYGWVEGPMPWEGACI